ncbi:uncharacterized protein METZ01_LOCUS99214 [marine metagenome]|uniref:Uncharacterized protein n=1 Tax=marine metagenome TaxID=408172 RepID=A0A381W1F9_9ZZZZ
MTEDGAAALARAIMNDPWVFTRSGN